MVQCPMNRPRNHRTLLPARTSRRSPLPLLATSSPISHFGTLCFLSLAHSSAISWGWGVDCPAAVVPRLATSHSSLATSPLTKIFHSPYPATPLFATLTQTAGVYVISSQYGTRHDGSLNFHVPAPTSLSPQACPSRNSRPLVVSCG